MLEEIKKRRSYREFIDKEIKEEKIREILLAAMVAPSAKNRRPRDFIVVREKKMLERLAESGPWAQFIKDASVAIVIVGDKELTNKWIEDCALSAGYIYLEAENQRLGTCWAHIRGGKTTGGEDAEEFVKKLLVIPRKYGVLCIMALGYPSNKLPEHTEEEFAKEKLHWEKW